MNHISQKHLITSVTKYQRNRIAIYLFEYLDHGQINELPFTRSVTETNGISKIYCAQAKLNILLFWENTPTPPPPCNHARFVVDRDTGNTVMYFSYQEVLDDVNKVVEKIKQHVKYLL